MLKQPKGRMKMVDLMQLLPTEVHVLLREKHL